VKENCFSLSFIPVLLPGLTEGVNRQGLPVFWRFCPIAKSVGGRQRPSRQAMREKQRDTGEESEWATRRRSDPGKLAIAVRLRSETTLPIKWIAG
jgi:hypothetical protein